MVLYQGDNQLAKETKRARCILRQIALDLLFCRLVGLSGQDFGILPVGGLFAVRDQQMGACAIAGRGFIFRASEDGHCC